MSTQYGVFVHSSQLKKPSKTQASLQNKPYSNRANLVLYYWLRNGHLTSNIELDANDIFKLIVKYSEVNRLWIIYANTSIFAWRLSSANPVKERLHIRSLNDEYRPIRYHVDPVANVIYGFGDYARDTKKAQNIVRAQIVNDAQNIEWEVLGKIAGDPYNFKKIRVFNNESILFAESALMIPDAWGAHAQRNYRILDFNLKENKYQSNISYREHSSSIIDAMEQINQDSFLCCSQYAKSVFLLFPKERKFKTLQYDESWRSYAAEACYCSEYNPLNANNLYCGQGTKLKHYNLIENKWYDCSSSYFEHVNYSTPNMIGYNIVTAKWFNNDPHLLYVASMNRKDPNNQLNLHQDHITNHNNVQDGDIVNYVVHEPLNEEIYDIRCDEWTKMNALSIEVGPLKWAKFIRQQSRRCPVFPAGAGCSDKNCILPLGRQLLYFC